MPRLEVPEGAQEISHEAFSRVSSPTAANSSNRLYGRSGAMEYRVVLGQQGGAMTQVVVNAETGDDAAERALRRNPGWKCIKVVPASDPDGFVSTDDFATGGAQ